MLYGWGHPGVKKVQMGGAIKVAIALFLRYKQGIIRGHTDAGTETKAGGI